MSMTPGTRKLALVAHITTSVGWLGAVASFLAVAIAGLIRQDPATTSAAYLAMELVGWFVIVPLSFASLLTGIVSSLGTTWGLFRHYWVVAKITVTIPATVLLLFHLQPIGTISSAALAGASGVNPGELRIQLVAEAGAAILVLLVATILSVYKPPGLTRYGWSQQYEQRAPSQTHSQ